MATPQPAKDEFVSRYCVVKHSWRGTYTRLFCIGRNCVATINPNSIFRITNLWDYPFVMDITPVAKSPTDFTLNVRKGSGTDSTTFSCASNRERTELLTDVQQFRFRFERTFLGSIEGTNTFPVRKYRQNEEWKTMSLFVTNTGIYQRPNAGEGGSGNDFMNSGSMVVGGGLFEGSIRPGSNADATSTSSSYISSNPNGGSTTPLSNMVGCYHFNQIKAIGKLRDDPESIVIKYGRMERLHLYHLGGRSDAFKRRINDMAAKYLGMPAFPEFEFTALHEFDSKRLGIAREQLLSTAEFPVMKISKKHNNVPIRRTLSFTETCVVERDPATYNAVSSYPLQDIFAVIRSEEDAQLFMIEYTEPQGLIKKYTSPCRDALLAHVVDSCRAMGNTNVSVLLSPMDRGKRAAPYRCFVNEEIESTLLRCLIEPAKGGSLQVMPFNEIVEYFNANVEYNGLRFTENKDGLFAENREKLIFGAVMALLDNFPQTEDPFILVQQFYALRRLFVSRTGFSSAAIVPTLVKAIGAASVKALKLHHNAVSHAVIDFLNTLMTPMHDHFDLYHEQVNKHRMLTSETFVKHLLGLLKTHIEQDSGALVIQALLDFFVYALCPPFSDTTDQDIFLMVLSLMVNTVGKHLYSLSHHSCKAIRFQVGMIIRVILEEGNEDQFIVMQRASLSEGGFLRQFYCAAGFNSNSNSASSAPAIGSTVPPPIMGGPGASAAAQSDAMAMASASLMKERELRDLARRLIAFFSFENQQAQDLLRRMVPVTMLHFLQSKDAVPEDEQEKALQKAVAVATSEWIDSKKAWFKKKFSPKDVAGTTTAGAAAASGAANGVMESIVVMRVRDVQVSPTLNWPMFFYQLKRDHLRPDLIWNYNTRTELREGIETEMQAFQTGLELKKERQGGISWNYTEFEILYPSLKEELRIGNHYPRLLFECSATAGAVPQINRPKEFFNDMYHRFLLVQDPKMKLQCLHGMALLYQHYAEEIGQFHDIEFLMQMLEATTNALFRDRMLLFISQLLRARLNVKPFIDSHGMKPLVELLPLAHLHVDRPQIHSNTMTIESSSHLRGNRAATAAATEGGEEGAAQEKPLTDAEVLQDQEKEWHYTSAKGERCDPVSYLQLGRLFKEGTVKPTTKVWAQGQAGWKDMKDVPQLKWGIVYKDQPSLLTLTEVSTTVLDILTLLCAYYPTRDEDGSIMQPLPRIKRYLADPTVLPHIVQLLLTFDPTLCNRVCRLVYLLMEDNPLMPRLFLTGAFFFLLMYTGSDIIPMCKLLQLTHRLQSFRFPSDHEVIRTSILSPMLPPAMVCVLANHGFHKFAEIFLGEFETPEAIWGKAMRRYLIEKIAAHISEFTPRLLGNIRAMYAYCPIVGVEYDQLASELFCSNYYLRHLCDDVKYPTWPIIEPVALMRDILTAWKLELEKKPSTMTREFCLETLELTEGSPSPAQIRKAYFKLAAMYHPDKNPGGRDKFEAVQRAYEYLAAQVSSSGSNAYINSSEPDPAKIYLLVKAQSILFSRFPAVMSTYKYAGYSLLLRLIQLELQPLTTENGGGVAAILNKPVVLLEPAVELTYHTVNNNALNADELLSEGGFDLMKTVLEKVFEFVTPNSKDADLPVKISMNAIRTFKVAAKFQDCLVKIQHMSNAVVPILATRGIAYIDAPALSRACIAACTVFCQLESLQEVVVNCGAVWHLLLYIFKYDFTLAESGVEIRETSHSQYFLNLTAMESMKCLRALTGYHPNIKDPNALMNAGFASRTMSQGPVAQPAAGSSATDEEDDIISAPHRAMHLLLNALLTPFIVNKMRHDRRSEAPVLKLLNSNHETPYFLWNNQSRAELKDFISKNSEICRERARTGTGEELPPLTVQGDGTQPGFAYSNHQNELIVGGVFVRIYNLQPHYPIDNPDNFFNHLMVFLQRGLAASQIAAALKLPPGGSPVTPTYNPKPAVPATTTDSNTTADSSAAAPTAEGEQPTAAMFSDPVVPEPPAEPPQPDFRGFDIVLDACRNIVVAYPQTHGVAAASVIVLIQILTAGCIPTKTNGITTVRGGPPEDIVVKALDLLTKCCQHPSCLDAFASIDTSISSIILAMQGSEKPLRSGIALCHQLLSDRQIAQQCLDRGLYVILLHFFATTRYVDMKEMACQCLAKVMADRLSGPKVLLRSAKLLPMVFLEGMRENPTQVCQMFEVWQENPELVWNARVKEKIVFDLTNFKNMIVSTLWEDRLAFIKPSEEWLSGAGGAGGASGAGGGANGGGPSTMTLDDVQVGGVYLTLFLKTPSWSVRKPRDFLSALLESFVEAAMTPDRWRERFELIASALASFLVGQPSLTDFIVSQGWIPKVVRMCDHEDNVVRVAAGKVVHEIAGSKACVESMGNPTQAGGGLAGASAGASMGGGTTVDTIAALMRGMDRGVEAEDLGILMDTLERLMARSSEKANMIRLAVMNRLPEKLLSLLETGMTGHTNASSARAIIIKVLKTMSRTEDPIFGPQVHGILNASSVWWKYKDQNHELFLTSAAFGGFITGPSAPGNPAGPSGGGTTGVGAVGGGGGTLFLTAAPVGQGHDEEPPPL